MKISCITTGVLTAERRLPKDCQTICAMNLDPLCASAPGETPKSFGNRCVLQNYNCENHKNLVVISEDECPGGGGIRLS